MAETLETSKPGFRNGFPIRDLRDGSMISAQADGEELGADGKEFITAAAQNRSVSEHPATGHARRFAACTLRC